jgi:hypothetical protein
VSNDLTRVPIDHLLENEQRLRKAQSDSDITSILKNFNNSVDQTYWQDWMIILASHQASKMGSKGLQAELLRSTSFSGYHFFNR